MDKIRNLLAHGENKRVEFKKCTDKVSASVYETVCAFLNAEGGTVFLGVNDDGTVTGVNPKCASDMIKSIINTLNNPEQLMKWAEELGSGQKNIRKYAPMYFENTEIEIHSGEEFVFSITYRNPKDYETDKETSTNYWRVSDKSALSRDQVGTKSRPNRHQVGTKSALSRNQAGTKSSLGSVVIKSILNICSTQQSLTDIMNEIGRNDRTKFKKKHINPLIAKGLLAMTVPDKPNSRLQKYYTTESGMALLEADRK